MISRRVEIVEKCLFYLYRKRESSCVRFFNGNANYLHTVYAETHLSL